MNHPLVIIWQRFGPYHLARLRGAAAVLGHGHDAVIGLEVAGKDEYQWKKGGRVAELQGGRVAEVQGDTRLRQFASLTATPWSPSSRGGEG